MAAVACAYNHHAVQQQQQQQHSAATWIYSMPGFGVEANGASQEAGGSLKRPSAIPVDSAIAVVHHGKLHKRSHSGSSSPGGSGLRPHKSSATGKAVAPEEDDEDVGDYSPTTLSPLYNFPSSTSTSTSRRRTSSATDRIKPYLRKMSLRDDNQEQGRLDLSRPSVDEARLAQAYGTGHAHGQGLGLRDFSSSTVSDVSFLPIARRRSTHTRAISATSQLSSISIPPRQFVHPMKHSSGLCTPPAGYSPDLYHVDDENETDESGDVVPADMRQPIVDPWRYRRPASITSAPYVPSAHLSRASSVASLARLARPSQSNPSINSDRSDNEVKLTRRGTGKSIDLGVSSRASLDRAMSFLSRSAGPEDAATRAANIRAARRAFEEKEAAKARKHEQDQLRRRDTEELRRARNEEKSSRRKSETLDRVRLSKTTYRNSSGSGSGSFGSKRWSMNDRIAGKEYSYHTPVHEFSLPVQGDESGSAELKVKTELSKTKLAKSKWVQLSVWTKTRLLSCSS